MKYTTTYCGWKYEYDSETKQYNIIPPDRSKVAPSSLFKYYALSPNNVDALLHNYLYASHPNQLNDWFDCCPQMIVYDNPIILRNALKDAGYDSVPLSDEELIRDEIALREVRKGLWHTMYSKIGILSFSEDPWNVLMWSHYSQNKGLCIEFDYARFPFTHYGPFPINYQSDIHEIHLRDTDFNVAVAVQFNVKHKRWQYEKEWRLIAQSSGGLDMEVFGEPELEKYGGAERKFMYPINAIKSVGLGFSFFNPEELHFSEDFSKTTITLNPQRDDTRMRKRVLEWLCCHKFIVNIALQDGLNDIHFCTSTIMESSDAFVLEIIDKLI